jgi:hypothetical protein
MPSQLGEVLPISYFNNHKLREIFANISGSFPISHNETQLCEMRQAKVFFGRQHSAAEAILKILEAAALPTELPGQKLRI